MAIVYLDSNAVGTGDGSSKANAEPTLANALATWNPGDTIWMSSLHNEVLAGAFNLVAAGSDTDNIAIVFRVNFITDEYEPTTGADTINFDQTSLNDMSITNGDHVAFHGARFRIADDVRLNATDAGVYFEDCYFDLTSDDALMTLGSSTAVRETSLLLKNTTVNFSHANGGSILLGGAPVEIEGCTFLGSSRPSGLVTASVGDPVHIKMTGCDFSQMTSMPFIFELLNNTNQPKFIGELIACKLSAAQAISNIDVVVPPSYLYIHNTHDTGLTYNIRRFGYYGDVMQDTGVYYNGANPYIDLLAATQLSHQMASKSSISTGSQFSSLDLFGIFTTTGVKTIDIQCLENFTIPMTQFDAWIEIAYLGEATSSLWQVLGSREKTKTVPTPLLAGTSLADWVAPPAGSRAVKLELAINVLTIGAFKARIFINRYEAGRQFFYNPKLNIV